MPGKLQTIRRINTYFGTRNTITIITENANYNISFQMEGFFFLYIIEPRFFAFLRFMHRSHLCFSRLRGFLLFFFLPFWRCDAIVSWVLGTGVVVFPYLARALTSTFGLILTLVYTMNDTVYKQNNNGIMFFMLEFKRVIIGHLLFYAIRRWQMSM
jgi:hypothetical protein